MFYLSFKTYILENELEGPPNGLTKKQRFQSMLVQNRYQYILLRYLRKAVKMILVDKRLFLRILEQNMFLFISEFANHQQFQPIIQNQEVFERLLIDNSSPELIIF